MLQIIQIVDLILVLAIALISSWLLSPYVSKIFTGTPSKIDKFFGPIERAIFKLIGIDPTDGMGWKEYAFAAIVVNLIQMALAALIFTFQGVLPLNPMHFSGLSPDLTFMQVISFATNTNLQHYNGEFTLSYLSQMTAVQFLQFTSAATGISVAAAMVRGFIAGSKDLGNFYSDFVKSLTRILIPICFVSALILVWLGVPQTLSGYTLVTTVQGAEQNILVGPVASLVSIMQVGTNGGGYYGANSAYPFQNPNQATDLLQILLMLLIPTTLTFVFGEMIGKKKESRPIVIGAYALFALDLAIAFVPNPVTVGPGIETRFGGFMSSFWTIVTTAVTTGSVNSSLYGMNPLVILGAFLGMFIQATPGGKGVGLMYMIMYVIITVFIVGLMSGRTPEYLGMKITSRDVKLVMAAFLVHPLIILVPTFLAYAAGWASQIGVAGNALGFTQILYEFTTAAANNGSDFFGSSADTLAFNISTGIVMFLGRYLPIVFLLAVAGSMLGRKRTVTTAGLRTDSLPFSLILVASIILLVVLTFFPVLVLGPILSFFQGHSTIFG